MMRRSCALPCGCHSCGPSSLGFLRVSTPSLAELVAAGMSQHVRMHLEPVKPALTPSRVIIIRRKPPTVNGAPRSDTNTYRDCGASFLSRRKAQSSSRSVNGMHRSLAVLAATAVQLAPPVSRSIASQRNLTSSATPVARAEEANRIMASSRSPCRLPVRAALRRLLYLLSVRYSWGRSSALGPRRGVQRLPVPELEPPLHNAHSSRKSAFVCFDRPFKYAF